MCLFKRFSPVIAMLFGISLFALNGVPGKEIFLNETLSMKRGLYLRKKIEKLSLGDTVLISLPKSLKEFSKTHPWLSRNEPLLKKVAALPGDRVCRRGGNVFINGRSAAVARERDRAGAFLPKWEGCLRVKANQFFAMGELSKSSFDSRYFGPLKKSLLIGKAELIFEF